MSDDEARACQIISPEKKRSDSDDLTLCEFRYQNMSLEELQKEQYYEQNRAKIDLIDKYIALFLPNTSIH